MTFRQLLSLVAAGVAATGCFASKSDIALLQDEIRTMRAMEARADSAQMARVDEALLMMRRTNDSLRVLSQRFGAFQANLSGELFELGKQLITLQELAGMSTRRIMDLRAAWEERSQSMQVPDTTAAVAPSAPGPAQLFTAASDLMRRGSHSTARKGHPIARAMRQLDTLSYSSECNGVITDHITGAHRGKNDGIAIPLTGTAFTAIHCTLL